MAAKIAYIMSRFPHLSETFILREMNELERHGWDIALYPLILQEQEIVHPEAQSWLSRVRHVPYLSAQVLKSNAKAWAQAPFRTLTLWGRTLAENVRSPQFLMRAIALLPKAFEMARLMQEEGVTHIHAHYATHPALMAWLIHRLTGISYSVTVHAHDIFVEQAMLGTKLREASFIAAISEYNREYLAEVVGPWVRQKTHIVHCGVVLEHYQARSTEAIGQEDRRFELISTGSLQPYKGHPYLIEACTQLREQGIALRCRIIGEGKERPALERMIAERRLEGIVELLGAQPQQEVARLLATADCYVQPSIITPSGKMEGIPVALMEALACRLPVVATKLSGIPELVQDNKTGYLVEPANATALANALTKVASNPTLAAQLGQEGYALVAREFELSRNVQDLAVLFSSLPLSHPEKSREKVLMK